MRKSLIVGTAIVMLAIGGGSFFYAGTLYGQYHVATNVIERIGNKAIIACITEKSIENVLPTTGTLTDRLNSYVKRTLEKAE